MLSLQNVKACLDKLFNILKGKTKQKNENKIGTHGQN